MYLISINDIESPDRSDDMFAFAILWENGEVVSKNRKFLNGFKDIKLCPEKVDVKCSRVGGKTWKLELHADIYIWNCNLTCGPVKCTFTDNAFDIWPGETKTVFVETENEVEKLEPKFVSLNRYR